MDLRQNNRMSIKAVSVRHCAATTAPRNCCPAEQSHNDYARSSAVGKQLKQKNPYSLCVAQHLIPPLDPFWASFFLRVQLTSLPLISPGLFLSDVYTSSSSRTPWKFVVHCIVGVECTLHCNTKIVSFCVHLADRKLTLNN